MRGKDKKSEGHTLTRKEIISLLCDLTAEIDYDIYKGMFCKECIEEPEENEEQVNRLIAIVENHLNQHTDDE